jgi:hypothetical protein
MKAVSFNLNRQRAAGAVALLLLVVVGSAAEPLRLKPATRHIPERGTVAGAVIEAGADRESFILPAGWRMGLAKKENKVVLQSEDYSATMEIRTALRPEGEVNIEGFRDQVLARSERCLIKREYVWPGTQRQTFLFEATDANDTQLPLRKRVMFVVKERQVIEVCLTAHAERFDACQKAFEVVAASLRGE